jgi:hypothetical protein
VTLIARRRISATSVGRNPLHYGRQPAGPQGARPFWAKTMPFNPERLARNGGICVFVRDVDGAHAELAARGANVLKPPQNYDYGMRDFDVVDLDVKSAYIWNGIYCPDLSSAAGSEPKPPSRSASPAPSGHRPRPRGSLPRARYRPRPPHFSPSRYTRPTPFCHEPQPTTSSPSLLPTGAQPSYYPHANPIPS